MTSSKDLKINTLYKQAYILNEIGEQKRALEIYSDFIHNNASEFFAQVQRIKFLNELKDKQKVLERFENILKIRPNDINIMSQRAHMLEVMGRNNEAMKQYAKILKLDPANRRAQLKAIEFTRKIDKRLCLRICDHILSKYPEALEVICKKADIHRELGQIRESLEEYSKALTISPQNRKIRNIIQNVTKELTKTKKQPKKRKINNVDAIEEEFENVARKKKRLNDEQLKIGI